MPSSSSNPGRRRRRIVWFALLVVSLMAAIFWQRWALLQQGLEEFLAYRLGATVHIGELTEKDGVWRVHNLDIMRPSVEPRVQRLHLPRLDVTASWRQLSKAHLPLVEVTGGYLVLRPTPQIVQLADSTLPDVQELRLKDLEVIFESPPGNTDEGSSSEAKPSVASSSAQLQAQLFDLAGTLRGDIVVDSPRLNVSNLFLLVAPQGPAPVSGILNTFSSKVTLGQGGPVLEADGQASEFRLEDLDSDLALDEWHFGYGISQGQPGGANGSQGSVEFTTSAFRIERSEDIAQFHDLKIRSELPGMVADYFKTAAQLTAQHVSLRIGGTDWSEEDVRLQAQIERQLQDGEPTGWSLELEPKLTWFRSANLGATFDEAFNLGDFTAAIEGLYWKLPPDDVRADLDVQLQRRGETVEGEVLLHRLDGQAQWAGVRLHSRQLPLRAHFEGQIRQASATGNPAASGGSATSGGPVEPWLDGSLVLRSADSLTVNATGAWYPLADPPAFDVEVDVPTLSLDIAQSFLTTLLLPEPWRGEAHFSVNGRFDGPLLAPQGIIRLKIDRASLQPPEELLPFVHRVDIQGGQGDIELTGHLSVPRLELSGALRLPSGPAAEFAIQSDLQLDAEFSPQRFAIDSLEINLPDVGRASVRGTWERPAKESLPQVNAQIDLDAVSLPHLLPYLPVSLDGFLEPSSVQGNLEASWQVTSTVPPQMSDAHSDDVLPDAVLPSAVLPGSWHLQGPVEFQDVGYASTDGSRVVEGLQLHFDSAVESLDAASWSARLDGEVSGFVLLWDTFFGDFSQWQGRTTLEASGGSVASSPGALDSLAIAFALPQGPHFHGRIQPGDPASATTSSWSYETTFDIDDLAAMHALYLQPTFGELAGQQLSGGLALQAAGTWVATGPGADSSWSSLGQLNLRDVSWQDLAATSTENLRLQLPFDLSHREGQISGPRRHGRLGFESLTTAGFRLPTTDAGLWTEHWSLGVDDGLQLPIFGGQLILERLRATDLLDGQPRLQSAIELRQLDLTELSEAIGILPLDGTLEGRLERIEIVGQDLKVEGGGRFSLLGGFIDIDGISGSEVFSPFPRIVLSASAQDIDLGELTRRLDFGEMHGTLQGTLRDCALFRGVPVTCQARFETVDRPGVRRSVDVKAVNNLTVLGTGASSNVFDRGIQRLFSRFTYSRFGVDIDLANDSLLLRGLEKRGAKELFMSGRLPFPIDIVNAQPGRRVSFQAMLQRLETLDFGSATTESP